MSENNATGFDLSNVMASAQQAVQGTGNSGGTNYPPIIYPGDGTVVSRLLFNPKSNSVMRLIRRHKLESGKADCASNWNQDCPVCAALEEIRTVKGLDLWTMKSKVNGIAYAQFVSTSTGYDWGGRKIPNRGDLIVLMFPWSVYKQISELIQKAGENANQILTNVEGRLLTIERKASGERVEYRVDIDAFAPLFRSADNQSAFNVMLTEVTDLNDTITPRNVPDGHLNKLLLEANNLTARYLGKQDYTPSAPATPPQQPTPQPPQNPAPQPPAQPPQQPDPQPPVQPPAQQPPTPPAGNDGKPDCFGQLDLKNKQCLMCAVTIDCRKRKKELEGK